MTDPAIDSRVAAAVTLIDEQLDQLGEALRGANIEPRKGVERLRRWKERAVRQVTATIAPAEGNRLRATLLRSFLANQPFANLAREAELYSVFLTTLREEIVAHPADVFDSDAEPLQPSVQEPVAATSSDIFIVHGHDELNLMRLKDLLADTWNLPTIVMASAAGKGRTLIEKFEDEAQRAAFAFVLLTPDDMVQAADGKYFQARPNVIFELGWFYGRLGRSKVCILFKVGTSLHSDLAGISQIEFQDNVIEKVREIENELVTAGILSRPPSR